MKLKNEVQNYNNKVENFNLIVAGKDKEILNKIEELNGLLKSKQNLEDKIDVQKKSISIFIYLYIYRHIFFT